MTPKQFRDNIRARTATTSNTLSDADIARIANLARNTIDVAVLNYNPALYNMVYYTNLVANVREYRVKPYTRSIHYVQANLKASSGADDNWITLQPANYGVEYQFGDSEDKIIRSFSNIHNRAKYWKNGVFIFLLTGTIINVTNGLKIYANGLPSDLEEADMTSEIIDLNDYTGSSEYTPGVPFEMNSAWITLCSRLYKMEAARGDTSSLDVEEQGVYMMIDDIGRKLVDKTPVLLDDTDLNLDRSYSDFGFNY